MILSGNVRTHTVHSPHMGKILATAPFLRLMRIHTLMEFSSKHEIAFVSLLIMKTDPSSLHYSLYF